MRTIVLATLGMVLTSCASNPDGMRATDVSPLQYKSYDCEQIASENQRMSRRLGDLYQNLKTKANNDAWQTAAGFVLWPMFLTLEGGDGPDAAEYKQLKGEYEALQQTSVQKKCGLEFKPLDQQLKDKAKQTEPAHDPV